MSENNKTIYDKALLFTVVSLVVVLVGTVITVFVPLMTDAMHPKLDNVANYNYTPVELAGRDVYQKEGCINCHSQVVRPLTADVLRYGEISQPGESAYERPFLWGSKRTGPDLARIGGVYSDDWHRAHMLNPQHFFPKSNMPKYPWLATKKIDVAEAEKRAKTFGIEVTPEDSKQLAEVTELDALIAYLQKLGTYVENTRSVKVDPSVYENMENPFSPDSTEAQERGRELYVTLCYGCHGDNGLGKAEGFDMTSATFAEALPSDGETFVTIANGIDGAMPSHLKIMSKNDIWSVAAYVKSLANQNNNNAQTEQQ